MRRKDQDRRGRPRYEIVGELWGAFETVLRLRLRNLGANGALLASDVPLQVGSAHLIACEAEHPDEATTEAIVRHVRSESGADGAQTYLIGVEFVARSPVMVEQVERWVGQAAPGSSTPEVSV